MSISRTVFLQRSKMIRPKAWAAAIRRAGFSIDMDVEFDVESFSGFLPCAYEDETCGFEYSFQDVGAMELEKSVLRRIGDRNVGVSFVTRSDSRGLVAAVIAAAVLCEECDGVYFDEEAGELLSAKEARTHATELDADARRQSAALASSTVARAFRTVFQKDFFPLLQSVGFVPAKSEEVRSGHIAASVTRPLEGGRWLAAMLSCDGVTGDSLRFRLDIEGPVPGSGQVPLDVPWPDPSYPSALSFDLAASQFLPRESTDQLKKAIVFLAGAFAANADRIAAAVPELGEALRSASGETKWTAAVERAQELWKNRRRRGKVEDRSVPAKVVFVGKGLVSVDADGARLTFQFDTRLFDRTLPVSVSGWYKTPAGTLAASKLTNGGTTWSFDDRGQLVS